MKPKNKLQISLVTAIMLMLESGGLIWVNLRIRIVPQYSGSEYVGVKIARGLIFEDVLALILPLSSEDASIRKLALEGAQNRQIIHGQNIKTWFGNLVAALILLVLSAVSFEWFFGLCGGRKSLPVPSP